jgi:2-polyprenyl-3-methyl-5-hydroxy-6-metoxy-1,4-benzoquinol methylase/RNase P subunit RPR2
MERVDKLISTFMKRQYGLPLSRVYSKLRSDLLQDLERVACNLCGSDACVEIAHRDKYELAVTSVMCRECGLIYLNPRPTAKSYDRFYSEGGSEEGVYHVSLGLDNVESLLKRYYGPQFRMSDADFAQLREFVREKFFEHVGKDAVGLTDQHMAQQLEAKAREFEAWRYDVYADDIYGHFREFVPQNGKVFEMGAAWGKLLVPWRDRHGCEVTGIEPRKATVQAAKDRLGIELFQGFPGSAAVPESAYDAVFNIRTINHMLDPLGDLRHAWRWLKPGGVLIIDISDALRETRYEGFETNVVEIDHTYAFSRNTLAAMMQKAGFEIVKCDIVDTTHVWWGQREPEYKQIRIVGRKSLQPVEVTWPDPLQELATLTLAQFERERDMRSGKPKTKSATNVKRPQQAAETDKEKTAAYTAEKQSPAASANLWSRLTRSLRGAAG